MRTHTQAYVFYIYLQKKGENERETVGIKNTCNIRYNRTVFVTLYNVHFIYLSV